MHYKRGTVGSLYCFWQTVSHADTFGPKERVVGRSHSIEKYIFIQQKILPGSVVAYPRGILVAWWNLAEFLIQ